MKRVLIVYATRFGATEKVAKELAGLLEKNFAVRLFDLKGGGNWPSPENYEGVIVASSVAIFRITKEAGNYVRKYAEILKDKPFGFIFCSAESLDHEQEAIRKYVKLAVKPVVVRGVGVHFDFSESNRIGFVKRRMLEGIAKYYDKIDFNGSNDLLKHDRIKGFAEDFTARL